MRNWCKERGKPCHFVESYAFLKELLKKHRLGADTEIRERDHFLHLVQNFDYLGFLSKSQERKTKGAQRVEGDSTFTFRFLHVDDFAKFADSTLVVFQTPKHEVCYLQGRTSSRPNFFLLDQNSLNFI
jgi:hypothetical protein